MVLQKIGMNKMLEGAERLNRYMQTVDEDLKKIAEAFNTNISVIGNKLDEMDAKLDKIMGEQDGTGPDGQTED